MTAPGPGDANKHHQQGLAYLRASRVDEAVCSLQRAVRAEPKNATYRCNLGKSYLDSGRLDEAVRALQKAIKLRPGYVVAQYNLACVLMLQGELLRAAEVFQTLVDQNPDHPEFLCGRAETARQLGDWTLAIRCYQRALEVDPTHKRSIGNLGALLTTIGQYTAALAHCRKAVELSPQSYHAHLNLARCLTQLSEFDEAMEALAQANEQQPDSHCVYAEYGSTWLIKGNLAEASTWFQKSLEIQPNHPPALAGLAQALMIIGDFGRARELVRKGLGAHPKDTELIEIYAEALWDEGEIEASLEQLSRLHALQPENARPLARRGRVLASAGRVSQAIEVYHQALALNPDCIRALRGLALIHNRELEPAYADRLHSLAEQSGHSPGNLSLVHNGLSSYHSARKEWARAAEHMSKANAFQWECNSFRRQEHLPERYSEHCQRLREIFSRAFLEQSKDYGLNTLEPVFIAGMPRSGTTLTEQILASHPSALGVGERNLAWKSFNIGVNSQQSGGHATFPCDYQADFFSPDNIKKLAGQHLTQLNELKQQANKPGALRVVDKTPNNCNYIGWILTLFPNARIIHCRRDLRDVALSCWQTRFTSIEWANQWDSLRNYIDEYRLMMRHWKDLLGDRYLEIDYESLVKDKEPETRRLIDWIGLEWSDDCLNFNQSASVIRTASITQVRQPIYKSSIGRWKHYAPYIPELNQIKMR